MLPITTIGSTRIATIVLAALQRNKPQYYFSNAMFVEEKIKNSDQKLFLLYCTSPGIILLILVSVIHTSFIEIVVSELTRGYYEVIEK